ncbi:hypothetical protein [Mycoplasma ovis]|nr:hypothetical protein [Mycoplasma ovis]
MKISALSLFFASGGAIAGGSFVLPEILRFDDNVIMQISGAGISDSSGKNWIKIGGKEGEGIFVQIKGAYSTKGNQFSDSTLFGPARIGSKVGNESTLADEEKPIMIWSGEKGIVIFRGKRFFKNNRDENTLNEAKAILSEAWNKGHSTKWGDEKPDYYCKQRTENWKKLLNENVVVYAKHTNSTEGSLGVITPIEKKQTTYRWSQKTFNTPCLGTEIFSPEKVSLLTKNSSATTIEVQAKTNQQKLGYKFDIGEVTAVLYGRNKDLRITEKGIEDSLGNRIDWGNFLPKIELKPA